MAPAEPARRSADGSSVGRTRLRLRGATVERRGRRQSQLRETAATDGP